MGLALKAAKILFLDLDNAEKTFLLKLTNSYHGILFYRKEITIFLYYIISLYKIFLYTFILLFILNNLFF